MERIYLSRRNLVALLSKLDRVKMGEFSTCTLIKKDDSHPKYPQTMSKIAVTALEDDEYYADRLPGPTMAADIKDK